MINVYLSMGIISGDDKRTLEEYIDSSNFKQRKSYDEYYVVNKTLDLNLDLRLLMILAESFDIEVHSDQVSIIDR